MKLKSRSMGATWLAAVAMAITLVGGSAIADATMEGPVVVVAVVKVKPGTEVAFAQGARSILGPTRQEPGNIDYGFYQSVEDTTRFVTYEQWKSRPDLDRHLQTAHVKAFFAEFGTSFEAGYPQIRTYASGTK